MSKKLTMLGVGDIIPNLPDPNDTFKRVKDMITAADISFGQFEEVLVPEEHTELLDIVNCSSRGICVGKPKAAQATKNAGFDVVSAASNHSLDCGRLAFLGTLKYLRDAGLAVVGGGANEEEAHEFAVLERDGVKVAFLAYCSILPYGTWVQETRPGVNPARAYTYYEQVEIDQPGTRCRIHSYPNRYDLNNMINDIKRAKEVADIVVVSMHWGLHFVEAELADYQKDYAYAAIDAGADIILGHHAHILKGIEVYKGKAIFYSLGNFGITGRTFAEEDDQRGLTVYGARQEKTKSHAEIAAIRKGFGEGGRNFPEDCYKTFIAKMEIEDKKISKVSFIPAFIPLDGSVYALKPDDPMFAENVEYVRKITAEANLNTTYTVDGDEVIVDIK